MARYKVEFKAFTTGDWYTKTNTASCASAYSVAKIGSRLQGREWRSEQI